MNTLAEGALRGRVPARNRRVGERVAGGVVHHGRPRGRATKSARRAVRVDGVAEAQEERGDERVVPELAGEVSW